ncbi:collagenase [Kitasatospora sp. GP82]|uniref:collagenase n=1 Tax=Kitasatospora sp. GP82 TaxID=3035089 RepID=UPI002473E600|nr:collagenase [Kitasatospora sp. GP82]MDH6125799.1 microbial collagenase [Kitasatospora sp. GP82]
MARHRRIRSMAVCLAAFATITGLLATPALAVPGPTAHTKAVAGTRNAKRPLPPTGPATTASDRPAAQSTPLTTARLRPHIPTAKTHSATAERSKAARADAASCTPADFASRSGSDLVDFVKASTTDCVNTLFTITGGDAYNVFREAQMVTIADAFQSAATTYPGDNSTSVQQLVTFLRAGYYVQFHDPSDTGSYGTDLSTAIEGALDTFVANPHFMDVSQASGDVVGEAITLTDSANEQARYLSTYKQVLNAYDSSFDAFPSMINAVNNVYTPLFRGHQNPAFVDAVTNDPSILDTLYAFAQNHLGLLGTDNSFLTSNAGIEMARFVQHSALQDKVQPLMKGLLDASSITGPTAPLWVGIAQQADSNDKDSCSYYGTCNLTDQLTAAALPTTYTCDGTRTIRAQAMTSDELAATCDSLQKQDGYFHNLVNDSGPIPDQHEDSIQVVVFASRGDYQTYAGAIFGVDTDNGGITLTGNPADPANQVRSIMYQKSSDDGFAARIWNLNHEYTHYLDGRYDMKGDFTQEITVPDIWWIEGLAEYVSYSYRGVTDTEAVAEAGKHTYALSTLWQGTYDNSDVTRTYPWGYLAVRYMFEKHPADIQNMLAKFQAGDYAGGYAVYNSDIGNRYDDDFSTWLDTCATGGCAANSDHGLSRH